MRILIIALLLTGCASKRAPIPTEVVCDAEIVEVEVPIITAMQPPPAVCDFRLSASDVPQFVPPQNTSASSCLTTEQELILKLLISRYQQAVEAAASLCTTEVIQ